MTTSIGTLLSADEQALCEQVFDSSESPHSQRAKALLAIHEGMTQAKAAELAGLTIGQVRYCLQRFRQVRTGLFTILLRDQTVQDELVVTDREIESESKIKASNKQIKKSKDKNKKDKKKKNKKGKNKNKKDKNIKKGKDKKKNDKKKDKKLKAKKGKKNKKEKAKKSSKNKKSKSNKKKETASKAKKKSGKSKLR